MTRRDRVLVHALVLAASNICAVLAGFVAYVLSGRAGQLGIQIPVAIAMTLVLFAVWSLVTQRGAWTGLRFERSAEGLWVYLAAFPWAAVLFLAVHYATQGYLTSWRNVAMLAGFQAVVNVVAVLVGLGMAGQAPYSQGARGTRDDSRSD
jgi:hypothetical protein